MFEDGREPINFAECVSHLYYTENSSFAFHAILRGGYFHSLCATTKSHEDLMRTMMIVMAHLLGRQRCRNVQREYIDAAVLRLPSIVFLPPMPKRAVALLHEHNEETLATFTTYVETFAAQHLQGEDRRLPLTGINVGGDSNSEAATALGVCPRPDHALLSSPSPATATDSNPSLTSAPQSGAASSLSSPPFPPSNYPPSLMLH